MFNNVSRHYTYRDHPFKFAPRSPSRRNVRDLVNQSHDKKLDRLRMEAITQTTDDGMYVITRGCSQMSRVPQKINNIAEFFPCGCTLRTPNVQGEGVGSMQTPADKGEGGSKIGKILRTSFMYDPLLGFTCLPSCINLSNTGIYNSIELIWHLLIVIQILIGWQAYRGDQIHWKNSPI